MQSVSVSPIHSPCFQARLSKFGDLISQTITLYDINSCIKKAKWLELKGLTLDHDHKLHSCVNLTELLILSGT